MNCVNFLVFLLALHKHVFHGPTFAFGDIDPICVNDCACCINSLCGPGPFFPDECIDGCIDGHRGKRCYELCAANCKSCPINGECQTCYDGFYLYQGDQCLNCPKNCKTCTSNSSCTSCKEGFGNKDGVTTCEYSLCPGNCICNNSMCITCNTGFFEPIYLCNGKCPDHCVTCSSLSECSQCKDGYYNGYKTVGGKMILSNNCTHQCRETCIRCSTYDECLRCIPGKYGPVCQYDCSDGCKDKACSIDTGNCVCLGNFLGSKCTECISGIYSPFCNESCPKYCKNNVCDKILGTCGEGCKFDTITGTKCNICIAGMFGDECNELCSKNCKDHVCDRHKGDCSNGCSGDFIGTYCDTCKSEKYGKNCEYSCPGNCKDAACKQDSGNCLSCVGNFYGNKCDACKPGLFGIECNKTCSPYCANGICDMYSGTCTDGCKGFYSGDRCCVENGNCLKCSSETSCKECKPGFYSLFCDKICPTTCDGGCNFDNGTCESCAVHMHGLFCNKECSDKCKEIPGVRISRCYLFDGSCYFGCNDGFHGIYCNNTCSSLCIDNVCLQQNGRCTNGCKRGNDETVCLFSSDQTEDRHLTTVVVLASVLGIAACAAIFVGIGVLVKRRRTTQRNLHNANTEVSYENTIAMVEASQDDAKKDNYEEIKNVEVQEHEYLPMHLSTADDSSVNHTVDREADFTSNI